MKVYLANSSEQKTGGGFSFVSNFRKGLGGDNATYDESDIYFISGATMVSREEVQQAKTEGKKIVLRIDNAVRNSRNRNTGMSRMKDFAGWADLVIYQSKWARDYLMPFLEKDGPVVHNGVDLSMFNSDKRVKESDTIYGYVRFNRDETKNWEVARYTFSQLYRLDPKAKLYIIGNFSPEMVEYNFDFYADERYQFFGVQPPIILAGLYRRIDYMIIPYYNDACSNTVIESLVSGCELFDNPFLTTGGTPELLAAFKRYGKDYFGLERMTEDYLIEMEHI